MARAVLLPRIADPAHARRRLWRRGFLDVNVVFVAARVIPGMYQLALLVLVLLVLVQLLVVVLVLVVMLLVLVLVVLLALALVLVLVLHGVPVVLGVRECSRVERILLRDWGWVEIALPFPFCKLVAIAPPSHVVAHGAPVGDFDDQIILPRRQRPHVHGLVGRAVL